MSEQLKNLVKKLGEDPQMRDSFKDNMEPIMEEHGLSEEHKELFRKNDKAAIVEAAGANSVHADFIIL